jgi:hypothetical protein
VEENYSWRRSTEHCATLEVAVWQQGGGYEDSDGVMLAM